MLELAQELKLPKVGTVSVDGTTLKANAGKNRNVRHGRAAERVEQLELEVRELMEQAERNDQRGEAGGQSLPGRRQCLAFTAILLVYSGYGPRTGGLQQRLLTTARECPQHNDLTARRRRARVDKRRAVARGVKSPQPLGHAQPLEHMGRRPLRTLQGRD